MKMFTLYITLFSLNLINVYSIESEAIQNLWKIRSPTLEKTQEEAVTGLIRRLLNDRVNEFQVVINIELLNNDFKDKFILESVGDKIKITGTSGVAAANGFNYYLKYFTNSSISWSGDQLNIPSPLPQIKTKVYMTIQDKFRYYQNVCTASYTMVWWDFNRWQREIDWMAMRAINFPLAFNGQELVWRKVFEMFGLTDAEINDYFSGAAFLAWNRMGNFQGWSGPLTDYWHKTQAIMQAKILERMRSFGMIPILPAFSGHVPRNITRVFPEANVTRLRDWGRFNQTYCCTSFLDPNDSHFELIGVAFINEYKNMFGSDHFYNTDLFNEMTPPSKDINYLSNCGKAVYQSLVKSDPNAIWVMQGWLFHNEPEFWHKEQVHALLTSVPEGKLIILDLYSELYPVFNSLDGYFGQPFIWCMLQNFGGALGLYGAFNHINSEELFDSRQNYSNMIGIGLTPEGIEQNDIIYDFMTETTWYTSPIDLDKWVSNYVHRRYGVINDDLLMAWHLLQISVYTDPIKVRNHGQYIFIMRPSLTLQSPLWYDIKHVYHSFELFINASSQEFKNSSTFNYDLVDITRQCLQLLFDDAYKNLNLAYKTENKTEFDMWSKLMIKILDQMESILSSNEHFLLANWIESAKSLAVSDEERHSYEYQARNQITIWGPNANIIDYATKQWSGMVSDYYLPRWQLFIDLLGKSLSDKKAFNQTNFNEKVFNEVELNFVNNKQNKTFSVEALGNSIAIAVGIYNEYNTYLQDISILHNKNRYAGKIMNKY